MIASIEVIRETFPVGLLGCNCTVLGDPVTKEAVVVDPGGDPERVIAALQRHGLHARAILHTHTHIDHVGGTHEVQQATGAPVMLHEKDLFLYQMLETQARLLGVPPPPMATVDRFLADDTVRVGSLEVAVIHTPGHTPGSVAFSVQEQRLLLAGDTLFAGSIGRTDLWGGSLEAIVSSIRDRLFALPDDTRVVCGHGPETTIGAERQWNPLVGNRGQLVRA